MRKRTQCNGGVIDSVCFHALEGKPKDARPRPRVSSFFSENRGLCRFAAIASFASERCCQQIAGLDYKSFSIVVYIDAKKKSMLGEMLGDAVRPALCM